VNSENNNITMIYYIQTLTALQYRNDVTV